MPDDPEMPNKVKSGSLGEAVQQHIVFVVLALCAASIGAAFLLHGYVNGMIDEKIATAKREGLVSQLTAQLVLEPKQSDISLLRRAVEEKRAIFVSYTRPDGGTPHRWLRQCDHTVIDSIESDPPQIICLMLRLPDTNYASQTRIWNDSSIFEDHLVSSNGSYFLRKYTFFDGTYQIIQTDVGEQGNYREAWWFVFPSFQSGF